MKRVGSTGIGISLQFRLFRLSFGGIASERLILLEVVKGEGKRRKADFVPGNGWKALTVTGYVKVKIRFQKGG